MSGFSVYPQPVQTNRFVLKQNTAGQVILPGLGLSVTATTSSSDEAFGGWVEVVATTPVEYYITGVVAKCAVASTSGLTAPLYVAVGVGNAGGEVALSTVPIGSSMGKYQGTSPTFVPGGHALLDAPIRVAAGSRLAVRVALDSPVGQTRNCQAYLLAVPYSAVEGN